MPKNKRVGTILFGFITPIFALLLLFLAASPAAAWPIEGEVPASEILEVQSNSAAVAPTLTVSIISPRYVILDNNNPAGADGSAPRVYVVEAVITNTSGILAEDLLITLDYNDDPQVGWVLQTGADPQRTEDSLGPGETYNAYWFASYPSTPGLTHVYTVTAQATGFDPSSTSENYYGPPDNGGTVQTRTYLGTGNSGIVQVGAEIVVGVAYTITIDYDLGTNPRSLSLGPAGNNDFDASTSRLIASSVRFHSDGVAQSTVVDNRLYFPVIPELANGNLPALAEATYTLLPLRPAKTRLCPYGGVGYNSNSKYDNRFCDLLSGSIVTIDGSLSITMTKTVDQLTVEQGELLQYTLEYTNDGSLSLGQAWIWDEIDPAIGRIIASTTVPIPDINESSNTLVAWDLETVAAGESGTFTVTVLVDGNGLDLANGYPVVNNGFFGVNPGSLPQIPALTATTTSLIQAPVVTISKSDGLETVGNGEPLVYTVTVTNDGPVSASGLVITDVLPVGINYGGGASGSPDFDGNQILNWPFGALPDIGPGGNSITLTIPVSTEQFLPSFTVLTNTAEVSYDNPAGYRYQAKDATDMTTVQRNAGFVEGYAFIDSDGDGIFDDGENGLAGVTITLTEALAPVATTDANGYYKFQVELPDLVWVESGLLTGFFRTTPGAIPLNNIFQLTQRVDFGYAQIAGAQFGTIFGLVFEDANYNGFLDSGENGLFGVNITSAEATTTTVQTHDQGQFTLRFDSSGIVTVTETNPAGYLSTMPDAVQVQALLGSHGDSPVDFGDFQGIKVTGKVFEDLNLNGVDDGEPGLAGATVSSGFENDLTLSDGLFTLFISLDGAGPIEINESDPAGFVSTNAIPGAGMGKVNANTLRIDAPVSGTEYVDGKFGDVLATQAVTITGQVWNDNGQGGGGAANGVPDGAEPGLTGALVTLSSGMVQTTAVDGNFVLYGPAGTTITVTETNPAAFVSTNAIPGDNATKWDNNTLVVEPQDAGTASAGNLFGDVRQDDVVTISGTVWNDNGQGGGVAGDGQLNGTEPFLSGAHLSLDTGMSQMTASNGDYVLYGPAGQTITITENNPAGYLSSGAIAGSSALKLDNDHTEVSPLSAGGASTGNNFGDLLPAGLSLSKSSDPEVVIAGTTLTYTLSYVNSGPSYAQDVLITDTLPAGVAFGGMVQSGDFGQVVQLGQTISWTADSVGESASGSIIFTATVDSSVISGTVLTNAAVISSNMPDTQLEDNHADVDTLVAMLADLAVTKSGHITTVVAGRQLTYTITVANFGPSAATGVKVADQLPVGVAFDSASPTQGTYDQGLDTWLVGTLPLNGEATLTLVVDVDSATLGEIRNTATVSSDGGDPETGNNSADADTLVVSEADLAVSKADDPDPVAAGSEITYTISYTNIGPSDALGVVIRDDLSANAAFSEVVSQTPDIWTFSQNGQQLTWESAGLTAGQAGTIIFKVFVQPGSVGAVVNDVAIGSDTSDPDPENNIDREDTSIGDPTTATIYGFVFDDLDGNGEKDAGEPGIENVLITLDDGITTRTDADGLYYFLTGTIGAHKVEETDPDDYFSTTDNLAHVVVSLGTSYRLDFGDAHEGSAGFASILGTVFDDVNNNGLREDGELGIPGVSVTLDESVAAVTDIYGRYTFSTTVTGSHKVVETDPTGYISTTDNEAQFEVSLGVGYQVDFGDVESSSIFALILGSVFKDMNGNGLREAGELGIPGVTVTLDVTETTTTDEYGRYSFAVDSAGIHSVAESDLPGYFSTTPNLVRPLVSLGLTYQVDFGDAPNDLEFASIHGTVFEDLDSSGSWDPGEVGLKGVTVTLNSGYATTTDLYGRYSLATTLVGENSVEETDPLYYFSTTPNFVTVTVNLANDYQVDFGDVPADIANCPADSYEEDDIYLEANDLLPDQDQSHDFCDDPVDWYKINVSAGRLYTITTSSWGQRADTFLALFNSDGQEMLLGNDDYSGSSDFSSQVVWLPPHGGEFYLRVTNRADLHGFHTEYEMSLAEKKVFLLYMPIVAKAYTTPSAPDLKEPHLSSPAGFPQHGLFDILGPTGVITHMCMDDFEIDDTWTSAVPIASGETQLHSFDSDPTLWAADKDFVSFELRTNQAITFTVTSITGTSALLELYDNRGIATGLSGVDQLVFDPGLGGGHFYLSATPVSEVFGCTDVAGFNLTAELKPIWQIFSPIVVLNFQGK